MRKQTKYNNSSDYSAVKPSWADLTHCLHRVHIVWVPKIKDNNALMQMNVNDGAHKSI